MATVTFEITGRLAEVVAGDKIWVWVGGDYDGHAEQRTVQSVEYQCGDDEEWYISDFRVFAPGEEDADDPDYDWFSPSCVFLTEKEVLEDKLEEVERDIQEFKEDLDRRKHSKRMIQRRLIVLSDEEDIFHDGN